MTEEITRKLNSFINSFIKIKKLTKESEFHTPKTKTKLKKRTKNGAPGASHTVYNENG